MRVLHQGEIDDLERCVEGENTLDALASSLHAFLLEMSDKGLVRYDDAGNEWLITPRGRAEVALQRAAASKLP